MLPHEIESTSFHIIRTELGEHHWSDRELPIVLRVIHATADFDFRDTLRIHPQAVSAGVTALHQGCTIVTDVRMVEVGISTRHLGPLGGKTVCDIRHPHVYETAKRLGITRSAAAMRRNAAHIHGGIVAIGNAPTALLQVIRLVRQKGLRPALIVGVPVGFVNAVEAKAALTTLPDTPYITALGRKGGSTVAVAIVNALLRLAAHPETDSDEQSSLTSSR